MQPQTIKEEWTNTSNVVVMTNWMCNLCRSNKSSMPCLWWSTGYRCKLSHKRCVDTCCRTTDKVPAKILHRVDACRLQLKRDWSAGEVTAVDRFKILCINMYNVKILNLFACKVIWDENKLHFLTISWWWKCSSIANWSDSYALLSAASVVHWLDLFIIV